MHSLAEGEHPAVEHQVVKLHLHGRVQVFDDRLCPSGVERISQQVADNTREQRIPEDELKVAGNPLGIQEFDPICAREKARVVCADKRQSLGELKRG